MTSPGMSRFQEADIVTGTPGTSVGTLPSQGTVRPQSRADQIARTYGDIQNEKQFFASPEDYNAFIKTNPTDEQVDAKMMENQQNYINKENMRSNPMMLGMAYGGFIPNYMAYGGYLPTADNGINFSTISYDPNAITQPGGIAQGKVGPCTEEEVKDPKSPCYDPMYAGQGPRIPDEDKGPQTAQLKIKEQKGPAGQKAANIMGSALDAGALLADDMNYATERRTKYIPGMTEFAMGEKQAAEERINKGEWNARTGKEGIQGFEGVIRKGGAIKNKKSKASGHKINISDFQDLMKLAGLK